MAEIVDTLSPTASATFARYALLPSVIGWLLQIFLGGIATARTVEALRKTWRAPFSKQLLAAAFVSNCLATLCVAWEMAEYITLQDRSAASLLQSRLPDAIVLIPSGLTAVFTQTFMAIRCWEVIGRSLYFAMMAGLLELFLLASVIWLSVLSFRDVQGKSAAETCTLPTMCGLWTKVAIDLFIVIVLTIRLKQKQRGITEQGIRMVNGLVRLAFETCSPPLAAALFAAITVTIGLRYPLYGGFVYATMPALPSLYLLSFVYCLEDTQAQSQRRDDILAAPTLHVKLPRTMTSLEQAAQTPLESVKTIDMEYRLVSPEVHFTTWRPPQNGV